MNSFSLSTNALTELFPGLEAIDFQFSSNLGKRLTDLFQTVIDFRENLDYSRVDDDAQVQREYRLKEVYHFFMSKCKPTFKKIIEEETGIRISKLYCTGGHLESITGLFACDLSFGNQYAAIDVLGTMSGTGSSAYSTKEAIDDMMTMTEYFDPKKGRVTSKTYGKTKTYPFETVMYFDINCAFCMHDFVPTHLVEPFTAREIAAIMMHETGHAISTVEHAGDCFATINRICNFSKSLNSDVDARVLINGLSLKILPELKKVLSQSNLDKTDFRFVNNCVSVLSTASMTMRNFISQEQTDENILYTAGSVISTGLILWMKFFTILIMDVYMFTICTLLIYETMRLSYSDTNALGTKAGDVKTNYNNMFLIERWADEFVSRHGFGADLASSLNKISEVFNILGTVGDTTSSRVRNSSIMNCLIAVSVWFLEKINLFNYWEPIAYENQYQRAVRIRQNTYAAFKNINRMDGAAQEHYLRSVDILEKEIAKAKTLSDTAFSKALYNILRNLSSPVKWFQLLKNANLDRDLEILCNRIDDLKNNKLYYLSAKFASLKD